MSAKRCTFTGRFYGATGCKCEYHKMFFFYMPLSLVFARAYKLWREEHFADET